MNSEKIASSPQTNVQILILIEKFRLVVVDQSNVTSIFQSFRENEEQPQISTPIRATLDKSEKPSAKDFLRSPSDYFPLIRRGHSSAQAKEQEVVSSGWNVEVTSRKEREEALR